ncbi:MAG: hypothetical protein J3K34DRAFT_109087 [Monoraphidium minutum]|nr:MAG: hypothetical protein J3K34DRAFT_109087 [Monoraphidium minutum]
MLALLARQARHPCMALLSLRDAARLRAAATATALAPAAPPQPPPPARARRLSTATDAGGSDSEGSGRAAREGAAAAEERDDFWDAPFGDGGASGPGPLRGRPPRAAAAGARAGAAADAGVGWLAGLRLQGTEGQLWEAALGPANPAGPTNPAHPADQGQGRPPPAKVAGIVEEAQRRVAARTLPRRLLSDAVSKALALSGAFPSLSPRQLLTEAVVAAQAGAATAALAERARGLRHVLPDSAPSARLMLDLTPGEVSRRILEAVRAFRCGSGTGG